MNNDIKFTFVLPVHNGMPNGKPYIKQQIESILNQKYQNFKLIVLENCSDDGTREYLETLRSNEKVEIIPSDQLLTIDENWKRIINTNRSEYMIMAMADDMYREDYLIEIINLIKKYPKANVYRTNVQIIDNNDKVLGNSSIAPIMNFYDYLQGRLNHTYFETFQGYCFRTDFYDKVGGCPCIFKGYYMDDKLVLMAIDNYIMPVSEAHACFYRTHKDSESGTPDFENDLLGYKHFFNWLYERQDKKILKIIRDYLPFHIQAFSRFYTDEQVLEYKKIYKLFNINPNSKINKIKKWLKKHFYIEKADDKVKIRFLFVKLTFKKKKGIK